MGNNFEEIENNPSREYWEKRIAETADTIPLSLNPPDWVNSQELLSLVDSLYDIGSFYAYHHTDTVLDVEVVSAYVDFSRLLRHVVDDTTVDIAIREKAQERLEDFEGAMTKILFEAGANLHVS